MSGNVNTYGITHLRHVDLTVVDFEKQRAFYKDTWGLTEVGKAGNVSYLAAEGSPEQYIIRLRGNSEKRLDLIAFGAKDRASVDALATKLASEGIEIVSQPGELQTAGGGYGFRFFDIDGRTVEVSADVEVRQHRPIEEGEAIPVRISHAVMNSTDPNRTRDFYANHLGFMLSDSLWSSHMGEMMHFMQRLASQSCHRARTAHVRPPRLVRDARARRVHARHRPGHACRHQESVGSGQTPRR
jgi:catechol 2,3-dioxygenase-like lactoylglutathione lyase family enzyme